MPAKKGVAPLYWRPHDIGAWREDPAVASMNLTARAIFAELLDWQWQVVELHQDPERLRSMVKATSEEWAHFLPYLDELFPVINGVRQHHPTAQSREVQAAIYEKRVTSGRSGGRKSASQRKPNDQPDDQSSAQANEQPNAEPIAQANGYHMLEQASTEWLSTCSTDREGEGEELSNESSPPLSPPEFEPNPRESEALDRWDRHLRETRGRGVGLMQRGELLRDARRRRPGWLPDAVDLAVKNGWLKLVCPDEVDAKSGVSDAWVAADRATAVVEKVLGVKS